MFLSSATRAGARSLVVWSLGQKGHPGGGTCEHGRAVQQGSRAAIPDLRTDTGVLSSDGHTPAVAAACAHTWRRALLTQRERALGEESQCARQHQTHKTLEAHCVSGGVATLRVRKTQDKAGGGSSEGADQSARGLKPSAR